MSRKVCPQYAAKLNVRRNDHVFMQLVPPKAGPQTYNLPVPEAAHSDLQAAMIHARFGVDLSWLGHHGGYAGTWAAKGRQNTGNLELGMCTLSQVLHCAQDVLHGFFLRPSN